MDACRLIESAAASILFTIYDFSDPRIEDYLADAAARGVAVKVMVDPGERLALTDSKGIIADLVRAGVTVRSTNPSLSDHACQVLRRRWDNGVHFRQQLHVCRRQEEPRVCRHHDGCESRDRSDHDLLGGLAEEAVHTSAADERSPHHVSAQRGLPHQGTDRWGEDERRHCDTVPEERHGESGAGGAAAARGVKVQAITDGTYADSRTAAADARTFIGGDTVRVSMTPYYHVKMMIVDGTQMFVGSQNYSDPPLTDGNPLLQQREVGIIVTDPALIARAQAVFVFDWSRSVRPDSLRKPLKQPTAGAVPRAASSAGYLPIQKVLKTVARISSGEMCSPSNRLHGFTGFADEVGEDICRSCRG